MDLGKSLSRIHFNRFLWIVPLALCACLVQEERGRSAGTSVGTGNPGKASLTFSKGGVAYRFSGEIRLFGATQITVPGFQTEPLARFAVAGDTAFGLTPLQLETVPDSLWPPMSVSGDSLYRFNLVAHGDSVGGILDSLEFNRQSKTILASGNVALGQVTARFELTGLSPIVARINSDRLDDRNRLNFLFFRGTGFYAEADSGRFILPPMPIGSYEPTFVSVPFKEHMATLEDSANIYRAGPLLTQGTIDSILAAGILERVPMPEEYLPK